MVIPENIKYPNDAGLLNDVRQWLVGTIKRVGKDIGKKYRTYCRKGRRVYLNFAKSKQKTKRQIRRVQRQMLQVCAVELKTAEGSLIRSHGKREQHLHGLAES